MNPSTLKPDNQGITVNAIMWQMFASGLSSLRSASLRLYKPNFSPQQTSTSYYCCFLIKKSEMNSTMSCVLTAIFALTLIVGCLSKPVATRNVDVSETSKTHRVRESHQHQSLHLQGHIYYIYSISKTRN